MLWTLLLCIQGAGHELADVAGDLCRRRLQGEMASVEIVHLRAGQILLKGLCAGSLLLLFEPPQPPSSLMISCRLSIEE